MRFARVGLLIFSLLLNAQVWAQQVQIGTTPSPSSKDPQAVSIITQALVAAGGIPAIAAITDYTGTGTISYKSATDVHGSVVVRGSGLGQFRLDVTLTTGIHSEITNGRAMIKGEDGTVKELHAQPSMSPTRVVIPYLQLRPALTSPGFSLSYKGLAEIDGRSTHRIQLQRVPSGIADPYGLIQEYSTIDFFIDASTFQVLMMQDVVNNHWPRTIRYSDFRAVSGVLVPFSIDEEINSQPTRVIQLDQINFNAGLQDSDFQL